MAAATKTDDERLPNREEAIGAFLAATGQERILTQLRRMAGDPPQVLHLEGGMPEQRVALANWWGALQNCPHSKNSTPCLNCPTCLQIGSRMSPDFIVLDGRDGGIKIAEVRALRPLIAEAPRFLHKRVILLAEAQSLTLEAANSLLKILEEPSTTTCFVFTAPQRERLLPTLISRGWVLTLPWPAPARQLEPELAEWNQALADFTLNGTSFFEKTATKGSVDANLAQKVVLLAQKALASAWAAQLAALPDTEPTKNIQQTPLAQAFSNFLPEALIAAEAAMAHAQDMLLAATNPTYVLDYLATQLNLLR